MISTTISSPRGSDNMAINLQRLSAIRSVVLAGQLLALWYFTQRQPLGLPAGALALLLGGYTVAVVHGWWRVRTANAISSGEFWGYLLVDTLFFTLLLYYSGGASNPFVSYYLIPITIAAITLPVRLSAAITAAALIAYTALLEYYVTVPALSASAHGSHGSTTNLHIIGMWVNFAVSASLISYFISRMAATVRQQQQRLERQRADQLRSDQLTAIGLLAAGTAHELGTPLNTMKIVLDDLNSDGTAAARDDVALLTEQVNQCQTILRSLVETARQATDAEPEPVFIRRYIDTLVERWQLLRPTASLAVANPLDPAQRASIHPSIGQAIVNLLNNAADASDAPVELTASSSTTTLTIAVRDHGAGLTAGESGDGLGIGLSLTAASVERFGGQLALQPHPDGGTVALLSLPLNRAPLQTEAGA